MSVWSTNLIILKTKELDYANTKIMIIIDFFYRYINMQSYISTYFKLFWDLAFYIFNFFLEFTFIFTKPRRHFFYYAPQKEVVSWPKEGVVDVDAMAWG